MRLEGKARLILSTTLVVAAIVMGLAVPASAAAADASLPACSATGLTKSHPASAKRLSTSDPTVADLARAHAGVSACTITIPVRVPNPAAQGGRPPGTDAIPPLIYCSSRITLTFIDYYYFVKADGHFDCSGYVPYYMAIEVGIVNDNPDLGDVDAGTDGYNVSQLNYTVYDDVYCGVTYAGATRGAIKLSPSDPNVIFPFVYTNPVRFC